MPKRRGARMTRSVRKGPGARTVSSPDAVQETGRILEERITHTETGPLLTGGDIDADWQRAWSDGEEAVGGSVATPDQDVVDEIGRAWGVERRSEAPVRTSAEILDARDARRLPREAADAARLPRARRRAR